MVLAIILVSAYFGAGLLVLLWYLTRLERNTLRVAAMADFIENDPRHHLAVGLLDAMQNACVHLQHDRKRPIKLTLFFLVAGPLAIPGVAYMEVAIMATERQCRVKGAGKA